jgi:hypothetical protein
MRNITKIVTRTVAATAAAVLACAALGAVVASPAGAVPAVSVSPVLECVFDAGGGTYVALWGYNNPGTDAVEVPIGSTNKFTPAPEGQGQPTKFDAGRVVGAFTTKFDGSNLVWTLTGRTATASKSSAACKEPPVPVGTDSPQSTVLLFAVGGVIVLGGAITAWFATRRRRRTVTV